MAKNSNFFELFDTMRKPKKGFDEVAIIKGLQFPEGPIDVVLDTDTYNEIDDQYAIAYLLKCAPKLNLKALYAAPFSHPGKKVMTPKEGMDLSYKEIFNILHLCGRDDLKDIVFSGSEAYLEDETSPVDSPAARDLVKKAMQYTAEKPLYVIAIGAISNVASALLYEPKIAERVVIVWLGGHSFDWPHTKEFNMVQDIAGARVLYNSGAPIIVLPCMGVVSAFSTSEPELRTHLYGKNSLCDYLVDITCEEVKMMNKLYGVEDKTWTRAIWDVTAVAWLMSEDFMNSRLEPAPLPAYDGTYSFDATRHPVRYVYHINRDKLMRDLFEKLTSF